MPQTLKGLKVLILVAPRGFQDEELERTRKVFEESGAEVVVASTVAGTATGSSGASVEAAGITEFRPNDFAAAVAVGGPGASDISDNGIAQRFFRMANLDGRPVGGLSLGVVLLAKAGILEGRSATVWMTPDSLKALKDGGARYEKKPVVVTGTVATADGPSSAVSFANIFVELLEAWRIKSGRIVR